MDPKLGLVEGALMTKSGPDSVGPDSVGRYYRGSTRDSVSEIVDFKNGMVTSKVVVSVTGGSEVGHEWSWPASAVGGCRWLILTTQECPNCTKVMEIPEQDYLCQDCRQRIEQEGLTNPSEACILGLRRTKRQKGTN